MSTPHTVPLIGTSPSKAIRHNSDKNRVELIDPRFIEGVGRVLTFGAKKYADDNWRKGLSWRECCGSMLRHTYAFMRGERVDPESGESHLLHVATNAMFLYIHVLDKLGTNDLPTTKE